MEESDALLDNDNNFTSFEKFCGGPVWDSAASYNGTQPNLSRCLLHTLCIYVPVGVLWIFSPILLFKISRSKQLPLPWTPLNISRIVVSTILSLIWFIYFFKTVHLSNISEGKEESIAPGEFTYGCLLALSMTYTVVLLFLCVRKGILTSGVLFVTWFLFCFFGIPELRDWFLTSLNGDHFKLEDDIFGFVLYLLHYLLCLVQVFLASWADKPSDYKAPGEKVPEKEDQLIKSTDVTQQGSGGSPSSGKRTCPELMSSFLNQLTFWWFTPMAIKGWKEPLTDRDLWALNHRDQAKTLTDKWDQVWEPKMDDYWRRKALLTDKLQSIQCNTKEEHVKIISPSGGGKDSGGDGGSGKDKAKAKCRQPSIVASLFSVSMGIFAPGAVLKLTYDMMQFINPMLLKQIIIFVEDKSQPAWRGYALAFTMFLVVQTASLLLHQYFHRVFIMGMQWRGIMVSAVYNKSLKLSNASRKNTTVGEIVNLMSVDSQRFQDVSTYICMMWSAPMQIAISLYLLWQELGPSVMAGLGVMILLMPLNFVLMSFLRKWQIAQMKFKDDRIKLMNEVLGGIKVLKLYAWEMSFEKMILDIREKELRVLRKTALLNAVTSFTWMCAPFLVAAGTFGTYVLSDTENHILTPQKAFVSLALLNILRFPMTMLPGIISAMVQVLVSNRRLKDYFTAEELDPRQVDRNPKQDEVIAIRNGIFTWDKEALNENPVEMKPTLNNINLKINQGDLVAVVGQVGAGKSSLVNALLGEMDKVEGFVGVRGKVAYVPQQAWIQNMTVRDNILFGRPYRMEEYERVLESCALKQDLEILSAGDQTEIGEKGINLSGGQKQRISLARAVYSGSDIFLLDDPLSAVDSHVGKHIFDHVIGENGVLKGKTILLVTHGLSFLKHCNQIVVLKDGEVSEFGKYDELLANRGPFSEFLEQHLVEEASGHDDEGTPAKLLEGKADEEIDELLCDLEKCRPGARKRLETQLSTVSTASLNSHSQQTTTNQQSSDTTSSPSKRLNRQKSASPEKEALLPAAVSDQKKEPAVNGVKIVDDAKDKEKDKLIDAEKAETGRVQLKVYLMYMESISFIITFLFIFLFFLSSAFAVGSNIWLADWSDDSATMLKNGGNTNETKFRLGTRLGVYASLGMGQGVSVFVASVFMLFGMVRASAMLHKLLLRNLLRSPMSFYDVTPLGRIINRCGKDVDVMDNMLPGTTRMWLMCVVGVASTLTVISFSTPIFVFVILPLSFLYYFVLDIDTLDFRLPEVLDESVASLLEVFESLSGMVIITPLLCLPFIPIIALQLLITRFYVSTSRQLKRLESVSRSPIYSHFQETIQGTPSIRAYNAQNTFSTDAQNRLDANFISYYPNISSNRWLAIRLEFVGNCIVFTAALFAVISRNYSWGITAGLAGLSISYALQITQALNWAVRMTSDLETNIVAVERIKEYSQTPTEAAWETTDPGNKPPADWPKDGQVEVKNYSTRYRPGLDLVVRNVTCTIQPREKVGIVGRTGAGKSSLTLSLFRIIEAADGEILIDGRSIFKMGLHDLRSKLTIIPQDPVLFSGSLRMNLDPFEKFSDAELWTALEESYLKDFVSNLAEKLEHKISEGGENLSVGQRQLVCLARALLRRTKVLVLDEATAAVDLETDSLIQTTIRDKFKESTILTIAHRLNTILDYDRVLVLDKGEVAEFDSPDNLLANKKSIFFGMAKDAGLAS